MGSPAFFGKLATFESALRKPLFVPFGLFNPADNLGFIASISGASQLACGSASYASSLIIDTADYDVISILLTGNVSSTTLNFSGSSIAPIGKTIQLRFIQDGTGGRTVVLPTNLNVDTGFTIDPTPGRVTVLPIMWKGPVVGWVFFGVAFTVPTA